MKDVVELQAVPEAPQSPLDQAATVTITAKAAAEAQRVMHDKHVPDSAVLRVGVKGAGCSGFQYDLGFDENPNEEHDMLSVQHGLKVAVDKRSAMYLQGTVIDFYDGIEKRGFTFENPNANQTCGCGTSFSV